MGSQRASLLIAVEVDLRSRSERGISGLDGPGRLIMVEVSIETGGQTGQSVAWTSSLLMKDPWAGYGLGRNL